MFIGGIRALLLGSRWHLLASGLVRGEYSRLPRRPVGLGAADGYFLAVATSAGPTRAAIARVRAVHERVTGTAPFFRRFGAAKGPCTLLLPNPRSRALAGRGSRLGSRLHSRGPVTSANCIGGRVA